MADAEFTEWASTLGVEESLARRWYGYCMQYAYFAYSFLIPWSKDGVAGMLFVQSTGASTGRMKANHSAGGSVCSGEPHWLLFSVWWYPGVVPFQYFFPGYVNESLGSFEDFVNTQYGDRWRSYLREPGLYGGLRRILWELFRIPVWNEVCTGFSMRAYKCLDVYIKTVVSGTVLSGESAWWVCNCTHPAENRIDVVPEGWWTYGSWDCLGTRQDPGDWEVSHVIRPTSCCPIV